MVRASIFFAPATVLVTTLLLAPLANADVYKYKDDKGNTLYTDRPLVLPAERLNIQSQRTDVVALENRTNAEDKSAAERDKTRQQAQKSKNEDKKAAESGAEAKAEACNTARKNYLNSMNSRRMYEEQANGERRYLSDKELDASRADAKTAMEALCN